jgi:hypothetical protein
MAFINRKDIETLATPGQGIHISLYMPTVRAGKETRQNPTRFKNMMKRAREEFKNDRFSEADVEPLLSRAEEYAADPEVWKQQDEGLAIFISQEVFRVVNVPFDVEEFVAAGPRFHLKPIIRLLLSDTDYYVLTVGLGGSRLYHGNRYSIHPVEVPGMPNGMEDALRYDDFDTPQKTGQRMPGTHGAQNTAMHGHATAEEKLNRDMDRYVRRLERSVSEYLNGSHEPLILAGTDYVLPIYRSHNRYSGIVEEEIRANPNSLDERSLRSAAWERLEPAYRERRMQAEERFNSFKGHGRTSERIEELVPAAFEGRVQTVFARSGTHVWGRVVDTNYTAEVHEERQPGDIDLVDAVVVESLMRDAEVHLDAEDVATEDTPVAAIFRY